MPSQGEILPGLVHRALIGAIILIVALVAGFEVARGAEIVPSIGLTRATDGGGDAKLYGGVAFRGHVAPLLQAEIAVAYRSQSEFDDQLQVRMWPVTASLYVAPLPTLYAGAGVGWYNVTLHYADALQIDDKTSQEFGVHVGGGLQIPLVPAAAIDLNGRYVFLRDQESPLVPDKFNPDFWTTSLGLAIKF